MISDMNELPPAYYLPLGDGYFEPTEATTSPWDTKAQHGGPPTALLASCLDDAFGRRDLRVARISMDFLGPVPRTASLVQTELLRPGRRTQLSEGSLVGADRRVATARAAGASSPRRPNTSSTKGRRKRRRTPRGKDVPDVQGPRQRRGLLDRSRRSGS